MSRKFLTYIFSNEKRNLRLLVFWLFFNYIFLANEIPCFPYFYFTFLTVSGNFEILLFLISIIIFLALIFSGETQGKIFISNIFSDNLGFVIDNIIWNWQGMIIEIILIIVAISFFIHSIFDLDMDNNETTIGMGILLIFSLICFVAFFIDILCNIFGWNFF